MKNPIAITENLLTFYLRNKYPGKWIVVVNIPEDFIVDVSTYIEETIKTFNKSVDFYFQCMDINKFIVVCDTETEAMEVFNLFPEEKAAYTLLYGPGGKYANDQDDEKLMILSENT